jgi:hypothetical protein
MKAARVEQTVLLRAVEASDARSLARRIEAAQAKGRTSRTELRGVGAKANALLHRPVPAFTLELPRPLGAEGRKAYVDRTDAITKTSGALARATCAIMPGLADALGGETRRAEQTATYSKPDGE